jgi:hypothetical protein
MQKRVLTAIGVLLSAALTIQTATAAARRARRPARAPHPVAQQLRNSFGSTDWPSAAGDNKSCDIIWCYENGGSPVPHR